MPQLLLTYVLCSRLINTHVAAVAATVAAAVATTDAAADAFAIQNKGFMHYLLEQADVTRLLVPILYLMYDGRNDPARVSAAAPLPRPPPPPPHALRGPRLLAQPQVGLVHICTFVLLLLSGERSFSVALNRPFSQRLPTDLPSFSGNHADLLIVTCHKLVVNGSPKLHTMYNCFLTILSNVSPYIKALSLVASVKLLGLFELFTTPRFLYAAPDNHHYCFMLLDIFNNIIQYQYEGALRGARATQGALAA